MVLITGENYLSVQIGNKPIKYDVLYSYNYLCISKMTDNIEYNKLFVPPIIYNKYY